MSKSNLVTWSVELTEANAPLIDKINTLLVPGYTGPTGTTPTKETPPKKEKPAKVSMKDIKNAAKAASKEHSTGFVLECIKAVDGETEDLTLPKAVASIEASEYPKFLSLLDAGPTDSDEDDDFEDDDDLDDDEFEDDDETVDVDTVKTACKAYKEENGIPAIKKVLKAVGCAKYGDIEDLSAAKLTKLMKLVA